MQFENSIDKIVSTYNLPLKIRTYVLLIARRNIERLGLVSFDDQYRYIDGLIEKFQLPYEDRKAVRLDSPISGDRRTWHDIIPDRTPYEEEDEMQLYEAVSTASSFLSDRHRAVHQILLAKSDAVSTIPTTIDEIVADFLGIERRLEKAARLLEDPRFLHPERRLIHVKLDDSPYLQWGHRDYKGNPLDFWERHIDVYGRFVEGGRGKLVRFDLGLYTALRRYTTKRNGTDVKQMDIAIPKKIKHVGSKGYSKEIQAEIVGAYVTYESNANKASKHLPYSRETVLKYWKRAGLEVRIIGKKGISNEDERRIVEAHTTYNGSAYQTVKHLPFSSGTIIKYWRKHGLPILNIGKNPARTLEEEKQQRIVASYDLYFGNAREAARALDCSKTTVMKYWRKAHLEPKGHHSLNKKPV